MNLLRFIRENPALKYLLWIVIAAFVLLFSLPGIQMGKDALARDYAVKVGGRSLPPAYLRLSYQDYAGRVRQMLGDQYKESFLKGAGKNLAGQMVDQIILSEIAGEMGLAVSDQEVAQTIRRMYGFNDSKTENSDYKDMLGARGVSAKEFEEYIRLQLLVQKYQELLRDAQYLSETELMKRYKEQNDKYKATLAFVRTADFKAKLATPTDAELRSEYDRKKGDLKIPEQRSIQYLWVNASDIRAGLDVPEADIKAYYDQHKEQFGSKPFEEAKEQVRQTILFTDAKARERAESAFADAKKGLDSADSESSVQVLAQKYGLKVQSTPKPFGQEESAGPLGLDAALNKAVFAAEKGKWSAPTALRGGTIRFAVKEVIASRPSTFEDAKDKLRESLLEDKASAAARATADSLARGSKDATGLEAAAKKESISTNVTGELSAKDYIPLVGATDEQAGRALASASEGAVVGPLKAGAGYLVAVVTEHKPADVEKFREEKDTFAKRQADETANRLMDEAVARRKKAFEDAKEISINDAEVERIDPSSKGVSE